MTAMKVEIYTKDTCMFCKKAKAWMEENKIPYEELDVSNTAAFAAMQDRIPGAKTVPQIIIDGNVIGGWDNLSAYAEPILTKLRTVYPA
jgi:glutaredoxin